MKMMDGFVKGGPLLILRLEGAAIFMLSLIAYAHVGQSWWLFAILFLVPDLSMLGYLINRSIGAATYNAAHTLIVPAIFLVLSFTLGIPLFLLFGLIWFAHIGFDRMLGYGLKYASGFSDTHLGVIGFRKTA
jgi:hypothetical protein